MRFPPSFLDEIRQRIPISEVIGSRVTWDRRKTNASRGDYWACCPFHGEKTPSFHCEDAKGRYHCFGCGRSGDHFRFLSELDGLSFPEAVERLADQAGLAMPVMDAKAKEREDRRATLYDVMTEAGRFFQTSLQSAEGAAARAYLRQRGLSPSTQQAFGLGYAPASRKALKEHLAQAGYGQALIEAGGLVVHGPDIAVSYDRFRDRIMFPIPDSRGRIIAFGGRAMSADIPAKYLNSPETEIFHKSLVLYNFAKARPAARSQGRLIIAEGYMDVIALSAAGFGEAVAPLGTALTERQVELAWRLSDEPLLCLDGDEAGRRAAYRAAELVLPMLEPGRTLRFALLPEGRDPDDLIREEGPGAMNEVLGASLGLADILWRRETEALVLDTPEKRALLEKRLRDLVAQIRDGDVRRHYEQDMRQRLDAFFGHGQAGRTTGNRATGERRAGGRPPAVAGRSGLAASPSLLNSPLVRRSPARASLREAALIAGAANHPGILNQHFETFSQLPLTGTDAQKLRGAVLDIVASWQADHPAPGDSDVAAALADTPEAAILEQFNASLRNNRVWQALPGAAFEDALDGWLQATSLHLRRHGLQVELREAENRYANEESEANFERIVQLREELARTEGTEALIEGFGLSSGRPARTF